MPARSIFEMQAEMCKTMGNAARLKIVHALRPGPLRVGDIVQATGLAQAKVSQHLAVLRAAGIIITERVGKDVMCRIANPKLMRVCDLMREVLVEQAVERSDIVQAIEDADRSLRAH